MATAVFGVMMEARPFDISATPPTSETMFISIPMPVTIIRVDQGTPLMTTFSSATLRSSRTTATAKEMRPTFRLKKALATIMARKPTSVMICFWVNAGRLSFSLL